MTKLCLQVPSAMLVPLVMTLKTRGAWGLSGIAAAHGQCTTIATACAPASLPPMITLSSTSDIVLNGEHRAAVDGVGTFDSEDRLQTPSVPLDHAVQRVRNVRQCALALGRGLGRTVREGGGDGWLAYMIPRLPSP